MFSGSVVVVLPLPSFSVFYCFFFCFVIYGFKGFYFVMGLCCLKFLVKLLKDYSLEICCVFRRFVRLSLSLSLSSLSLSQFGEISFVAFSFCFRFCSCFFLLFFLLFFSLFQFKEYRNSNNNNKNTQEKQIKATTTSRQGVARCRGGGAWGKTFLRILKIRSQRRILHARFAFGDFWATTKCFDYLAVV